MPSTTLTRFNSFFSDLCNGLNDPGQHQLKLALTNIQPLVAWSTFSQIGEIAAGGGYLAGGVPLSVISSGQVNGLYTLLISNLTLICSGAPMAAWRFPVIYDSTTGSLIGFGDYGSVLILDPSELVNFVFDPVQGILTGGP